MNSEVRAALNQVTPLLAEKEHNLALMEKKVSATNADLHVFPELFLTGYYNRDLFKTLAEPLDGPSVTRVLRLAKRTRSHIVFGMPRLSRTGDIHNAAVIAGPDGLVGHYDKLYLPTFNMFEESIHFAPGKSLPVFETPLGRIGLCICYDLFFPEVTKTLALNGAEIIACISASPNTSRRFFEAVFPARSLETTTFLLYTNLVGPQDTIPFWGGATAYGPRGNELLKPVNFKERTAVVDLDAADLDIARGRRPLLRDTRQAFFYPLADPDKSR
ncbi:MAG: carbon-nitrogen hydrolase family protein [Euryarchaeota archaeon]|nr:carbon-nitrogen hydrolase family protein [Euryarchaeota archaeon]